MKTIIHSLSRFDRWFTRHFGWFFTNGNKAALALAITVACTSCESYNVCGTVVDRYELCHEHILVLSCPADGRTYNASVPNSVFLSADTGSYQCGMAAHAGYYANPNNN